MTAPFAVVGPDVVIGDDTEIAAGAHVQGPTRLGRENRIYPQACVGFDPQVRALRVKIRIAQRQIMKDARVRERDRPDRAASGQNRTTK